MAVGPYPGSRSHSERVAGRIPGLLGPILKGAAMTGPFAGVSENDLHEHVK